MPTLVLQCEDRVAYAYAIDNVVTIGRLPDNRVVLDHPAVSSHHACVFGDGEQFIVEDLQSTNGTFVNGRRVSRRTLRDGDVMTIGRHTILFDRTATAQSGKSASADTVASGGETVFVDTRTLLDKLLVDADTHRKNEALSARLTELEQQTIGVRPPSAEAVEEANAVGILRVVDGSTDEPVYRLEKHTSLIGAAKSSLVRLNGWFKPNVAVAITRNRQGYVATVIGGRTCINSQPLSGRRHELKDGDMLDVSGLVLEFRAKA
jgi:pSer/pThr/pTyr-binding forkhead associated (FHA) protein